MRFIMNLLVLDFTVIPAMQQAMSVFNVIASETTHLQARHTQARQDCNSVLFAHPITSVIKIF